MSPLTDNDMAELDHWLRVHVLRLVRESVSDAPDTEREAIMRTAMDHVLGLTWTSPEGARILTTLDGLARVLWQGIRHNHPTITVDEIRGAIVDPRTLEDAMDGFAVLNPGAESPGVKKNEPLPSESLTPSIAAGVESPSTDG